MKCKICGGELSFQDGTGFCENCKSTHRLDYGFENTEVYICYKESNEQGGRTKDSVIAEELYKKLENKKINTFCERNSTPSLFGDELQAANYQALYYSKVILVVGTSSENFDFLLSKYNIYFSGKTVIPVYTDIKPENLPDLLNRVQALNFGTIGAEADLIRQISVLLGKEEQIRFEELQQHKKKKTTIAICIVSAVLVIGIAIIGVLFHKTSHNNQSSEISNQEIYENAQALMESGDYLGAADLFLSISDFKNSTKLYEEIFNRYDGYYLSDDESISLYINIQNATTADIILEKTEAGKKVRIEESSVLENYNISISFTDSQNNKGKLNIKLTNDSICLSTTIESKVTDLSIGNQELVFQLMNKSDRPIQQDITVDTLVRWITNRTYLTDLKQEGYTVEFVKTMTFGGGTFSGCKVYQIKNSQISLMLANFDMAYTNSYDDGGNHKLNDYYIVGIIAPARVAVPQNIGNIFRVYEENNVLYIPKVEEFILTSFDANSLEYCPYFSFDNNSSETTIGSDTLIGMTSKTLIGENFNLVKEYLNRELAQNSAILQFESTHSHNTQNHSVGGIVEASNERSVLICVECHRCPDCENKYYFYKYNRNNGKIEFITEIFDDDDDYCGNVSSKYSELFEEFY